MYVAPQKFREADSDGSLNLTAIKTVQISRSTEDLSVSERHGCKCVCVCVCVCAKLHSTSKTITITNFSSYLLLLQVRV